MKESGPKNTEFSEIGICWKKVPLFELAQHHNSKPNYVYANKYFLHVSHAEKWIFEAKYAYVAFFSW